MGILNRATSEVTTAAWPQATEAWAATRTANSVNRTTILFMGSLLRIDGPAMDL
jgi:hypothetical protein